MFNPPRMNNGRKAELTGLKWLWLHLHLLVHRGGFVACHHLEDGNAQGFLARSDTYMHAMIFEFVKLVLTRMAIFGEEDDTLGACLIDDASLANKWSKKLTPQERSWLAYWQPIIVARVYSDLGFELDHVKTFWGVSIILYLNRVFADGAGYPEAHATELAHRQERGLALPDCIRETWICLGGTRCCCDRRGRSMDGFVDSCPQDSSHVVPELSAHKGMVIGEACGLRGVSRLVGRVWRVAYRCS